MSANDAMRDKLRSRSNSTIYRLYLQRTIINKRN